MGRAVLAGVFAAVAVSGPAGAHESAQPSVSVLDRTPVIVRGSAFGVRERVLVVVQTELVRAMQRTTATTRGGFLVRFDDMRLTACTGASIVATGARGHSARLKLALRECPGPILDP